MDTSAFVTSMFGSWWGLFEFSFIIIAVTLLSLIGAVVVDLYFFKDKDTGLYKSTSPEGDAFTRTFIKPITETKLEIAPTEDVDLINERVRRATDDLVKHQTLLSTSNRNELTERVIDRTNREIMGPNVTTTTSSTYSAPYTTTGSNVSARIVGPSISDSPFTRIDFRVDQHERDSVRILFLEGFLPDYVALPVTVNVVMVKKKGEGEFEAIKFLPVSVSSFSNPVLVKREDGVPFDDDLASSGQDKVRIIVTATDDKLTLFNSDDVTLESPLPIMKEIIATDNFVLMTATLPSSPFYENVVYPTTGSDYETHYPAKTPSLTHGATTAKHSLPSVVDTTTSEPLDLDKPSNLMLYGPIGTRLDRELYEEIKKNGGGETYKIVKAKISTAPNPIKPDETFISLSPLDYDVTTDPEKVIVGWVIGFGVSTDREGYNAVFPAPSDRPQSTLETALELSDTGKEIVIHNTERAVGCFGTEEADAEAVVSEPQLTPISEQFFEKFLRPVVLIRHGKIDAIISAPLTKEGGGGTKLLPRRLTLERGFIDVDDASAEDILRLSKVETNANLTKTPSTEATTSPMIAIFPAPDVIPFDEYAFPGLKDAIGKRSTSVIKVKKVIVDAPKEDDELVVMTSSLERLAQMPYGDKSPIILKGTRDGDPIANLRVVVQPQHPGPLPFSPNSEEITLEFVKIAETSEYYAEELKNGTGEYTLPPDDGAAFDAIICRMSSPPSSLRDDSVAYHMKFQVGLRPPDLDAPQPPDWALTRSPGKDAPLRHMFACSIRTTPMTGSTPQEQWLGNWFENRFASALTPSIANTDDTSDETSFDHFNNVLYGNNGTSSGSMDYRNVPIVISQTGNKIEKILPGKSNALYGPSGLVVFGYDACPPTDKNVKWRKAGDMTLVAPDKRGSSLPVVPISTHLQAWAGGEPMVKYEQNTKKVLRLDPRMAIVANVANNTDLLAVAYDPSTSLVKAVERLKMLWSLTSDSPMVTDQDLNLIELDIAGSLLQDLIWNRQLFKNNKLFLCVKIPSFDGIIPDSEKGSLLLNICDPIVFLAAASPEGDTSEANRSELIKSVLRDGSIESDRVSVPLNFAVKCGFNVGNLQ